MVEGILKEHDCIANFVLRPMAEYIYELSSNSIRDLAHMNEVPFEYLDSLSADDISALSEWLTEKVDSLGAKWKLDPNEKEEVEEEEEAMGDVDLLSVSEDGKDIIVNEKWLHHLNERILGDDGHPRKAKSDEDPHHVGLVLEWIYGSIVSTAEKARDSAKRNLGHKQPTPSQGWEFLRLALTDQARWEKKHRKTKDCLNEILQVRKKFSKVPHGA